MSVAIALFTQDLRLHDNPVLHAALVAADRVVPLFVLDDGLAATGFAVPNRAAFLADCLRDLDTGLRSRGGYLVLRRGDVVAETARVAAEAGAGAVHVAAGVTAFAQRREGRLRAEFGDRLVVHEAVLTAVAPGAVTPAGKDHYAVFTPYHRAWSAAPQRKPLPAPRAVPAPTGIAGVPVPQVRPDSPDLPPGGEPAGRARWRRWAPGSRDVLAADGTSRLSPYLHFGCLSATELAAGTEDEDFVRQLVWRDFHHQVLAARPSAARADYRPRGDRWHRDQDELTAWRAGLTGYPIVDAGMRQLAAQGWMHNRARLLTASFLAKTLHHDWREGAEHFLALLVDGDVANNQLNWQWVAGTGTDTRPNRVLNPLRQAERFDPDGAYVRRWVPELAHVPGGAVHRPWLLAEQPDYPAPLVELTVDRFGAGYAGGAPLG
ncbi:MULTISPECIES: deoxyribodipyrimidine photo-lyase [unclassified Kitasatospora]|uniref:cryptochrome/photolyase family protein n=1 Tax=unclassified Kitasatospora TaxID=2633591 RepID=UPI000708EC89|nr:MULTISPECIES: deoxyribodipyrimidine photo-lyase [unclassified Kitasatospora]KQV05594.1 deoxyribodipyrimidine photolyase [Kitasatospora sp. Root107]KRB62396.1 deoxyribodipyrimidine photolyase [Kitasatospora sp. Root187]